MFGLIKNWYDKLVLWIDWPPPKPRPGIRYVHWEFLGDILDDLGMLTDQEIGDFSERDFNDPDEIRNLIRLWVLPDFVRYTPASQEKIRNTLTYYLVTQSEKLEWVFPSFHIPLNVPSVRLFYSLVWESLYEEPLPVDIDPENMKNASGFPSSTHWKRQWNPVTRIKCILFRNAKDSSCRNV